MTEDSHHSPVTLDAIAEKAGVSRWTVAAALRGRGRVNPETAKRLRELATAMGYDPALTQAGRSLAEARHGRRARHHLVALSMPVHFLDLPYYADLQRGVIRGLIDGGSAAVVTDFYRVTYRHLDAAQRYGAALLHGQVDAAIVFPFDVGAAQQLVTGWRDGRFADRPVVTLMRQLEGLPAVLCDLAPALAQAVGHLFALGHRIIALGQWSEDPGEVPQQRDLVQRNVDAAGQEGLDARTVLQLPIAWMNPHHAAHDVTTQAMPATAVDQVFEEDFMRWLRAHPTVTAVVLPNDAAALRVLAAVRRAGLRVPEDLSVVGGDGTDEFHDGGNGRFLATRRLPLEQIGEAAAHYTLALVAGEKTFSPIMPAEYLPGRSVGACRR